MGSGGGGGSGGQGVVVGEWDHLGRGLCEGTLQLTHAAPELPVPTLRRLQAPGAYGGEGFGRVPRTPGRLYRATETPKDHFPPQQTAKFVIRNY